MSPLPLLLGTFGTTSLFHSAHTSPLEPQPQDQGYQLLRSILLWPAGATAQPAISLSLTGTPQQPGNKPLPQSPVPPISRYQMSHHGDNDSPRSQHNFLHSYHQGGMNPDSTGLERCRGLGGSQVSPLAAKAAQLLTLLPRYSLMQSTSMASLGEEAHPCPLSCQFTNSHQRLLTPPMTLEQAMCLYIRGKLT